MVKAEVLTGNEAIAYGAKLSRIQLISAYPITPQTTIVEKLASFIANGELKAYYIHVESEHSALAAALAAALAGVRAFTASSSQGLAYMHEWVAYAPGLRVPLLMAIANRSLAVPWNVFCDYSDTFAEMTTGWLQLYCENAQEALDTVIQGYRVAEDERVCLPVMVCIDGWTVSHTGEPVEVPDQEKVDAFLPPYRPRYSRLDPDQPMYLIWRGWEDPKATAKFEFFEEEAAQAAKTVIKEVNQQYFKLFGRGYGNGLIEEVKVEDAKVALLTMGSMTGTARVAVKRARSEGKPVGLIRLKAFRPFPSEDLKKLSERLDAIAVVDRGVLHGCGCGVVYSHLRSSLYDLDERPRIINFIAGLQGSEVSVEDFEAMIKKALRTAEAGKPKELVEWVL
ncbi:MAG: hypothetical protein QXK12_04960 [Candidatus Nezhaarchaeales archaeon]